MADAVNAYKNDISVSAVYGRLTGSSEKTADGMVVPHVALADEYTTTASKVLMGLRGDITLDHKVDLIDATIINRELLARETEEPSILPGSIRTNEVSGEDAYKLAEFLGNVSKSEHLTLLDSTYIKRALLYAWTESDGFVTEEIWKMITGK